MEPRWNRMVAYPGTVMHSGAIRAPQLLSDDQPRALTINGFSRTRAVRGCAEQAPWSRRCWRRAAARAGGGTARGHAAIAGAGRGRRAAARARLSFDDGRRHPVLYANDGQDMEAVGLEASFARCKAEGVDLPIVVAIDMPRDRMGAMACPTARGALAWSPDTKYGPVGTRAQAYSEWLAHAGPLRRRALPHQHSRRGRAVMGWSLGALNAFNLGWNYPELFATVGAFSPSFWLSSERGDAAATTHAGAGHGRGRACRSAPMAAHALVDRGRRPRGNRRPRRRRRERRGR